MRAHQYIVTLSYLLVANTSLLSYLLTFPFAVSSARNASLLALQVMASFSSFHLLESVADSIIPTYSSPPLPTPSHLAGLTANCLYLHFFTWGFFSSHMCNSQEMPRNVLLNTLHPQQLSTKNWPCFRNTRASASLGWDNSEAMFNTISKSSPGGFICSCPSDSMVDKTPLIGSSPSLSQVPTTLPVIPGIPFQINYCAGIFTSEYFPEEPNWERGFSWPLSTEGTSVTQIYYHFISFRTLTTVPKSRIYLLFTSFLFVFPGLFLSS